MCGTRFVQHPAATVPPALIGCCTDIDVADESGGQLSGEVNCWRLRCER